MAAHIDLLGAYRWMALTRAADERAVSAWRSGRGVGGMFSQRGHEAISVGAALTLGATDVAAPMHRDLGMSLVRGLTLERIYGNLLGRATGVTCGRDANLHGMGDLSLGLIGFISHLPHSVPVALGSAMAFRYRGEHRVALTTVGDGGTTSGAFWESINMAGLWRPPLVVIIENNQYAYSTPLADQTANPALAFKAAPHGVATAVVDGNDVAAVFAVTADAVERARAGGGATVIEAVTMRMLGHAIHDGAEYVPPDLLAAWEERDPIALLRKRIVDQGSASEPDLEAIDARCAAEASVAFSAAEQAPWPNPGTLTDGVYA